MFAQHAKDLFEKSYDIIPIIPKTKRPDLPNWTSYINPEFTQIQKWINTKPNHGIGILTERMPCIDIDVYDEQQVNNILLFIMSMLPEEHRNNLLVRTGNPPKILIPFKLENETSKPFTKSRILTSQTNQTSQTSQTKPQEAIEILGKGQMALFFGIHPVTNQPYTLTNELPHLDDLPVLTEDMVSKLYTTFNQDPDDNPLTQHRQSQVKPRGKPISHIAESDIRDILIDIVKEHPIPNHDQWLKVGMALHHQYAGGDKGLELWDYFSSLTPSTYNKEEIETRYHTFVADSHTAGYTLGTLKYLSFNYQENLRNSRFVIT